ncbi:MAG TPA: hypothetical protein VFT76_00115 [Actinomycetota bacterium]|nr:hypothetical protein [Actinomycetota bacterium]
MSEVFDEILRKAVGIRDRWPLLAENRFRWRVGPDAFGKLVATQREIAIPEDLAERDPRLRELRDEQLERAREWEKTAWDAWGEDGSTLLGWPIVCDETMVGIEPEVVYP